VFAMIAACREQARERAQRPLELGND